MKACIFALPVIVNNAFEVSGHGCHKACARIVSVFSPRLAGVRTRLFMASSYALRCKRRHPLGAVSRCRRQRRPRRRRGAIGCCSDETPEKRRNRWVAGYWRAGGLEGVRPMAMQPQGHRESRRSAPNGQVEWEWARTKVLQRIAAKKMTRREEAKVTEVAETRGNASRRATTRLARYRGFEPTLPRPLRGIWKDIFRVQPPRRALI